MQQLERHEAFEMAVLQWLQTKRFLDSLCLGGGTMLRLCHELPRYSLDMDFWFFKEQQYEEFHAKLYGALARDHDLTDAQNKHYSILFEIRREKAAPRLKIEIRKNIAPPESTEEKIAFSPHFPYQVLVRGFTLDQMLNNKVRALIERGEVRDAFDLEFLLRKGLALSLSKEEKKLVLSRLKGFTEKDLSVKLGSIILAELRDYYRQKGFSYLEEKISFQHWGSED